MSRIETFAELASSPAWANRDLTGSDVTAYDALWRWSVDDLDGFWGAIAEYFGVKEGVLVRSVAKDMPAAKAGLRAGDVIVRIEDSKVRAPPSPRRGWTTTSSAGYRKATPIPSFPTHPTRPL